MTSAFPKTFRTANPVRFLLTGFVVFVLGTLSLRARSLDPVRKAFVEASAYNYAPDAQSTQNFIRYSDHGRANDVLLLQLYMSVHLPDEEVRELIGNFDFQSSCWKDIDYQAQDRGRWPATLHVTRMYSLAKLYVAGNQEWRGSKELSGLLHAAMGWWFENMPVCPNWWHNDIGVPKKMTSVLLMLRDELSASEIEGGLKVLQRSRFGRTGQNKVWLAGNNLMKGLLIDDEPLVREACRQISEEISIADGGEGIQNDWSFHQHGPQIQTGNYGLAYAEGLSFWMRVLSGTDFDFSAEERAIVSQMLSKGICWSVWKGTMDPSFCGRQNFIDAGAGKGYALAVAASNMSFVCDSTFFTSVAREILQPGKYSNTLVGNRYYWRSDCGIHRSADWYGSIRMHSRRTIGFEFTNKENTLANFSADGAVITMVSGREFENIFACWDWRKVPGVTAYDDGKPLKCDDSIEAKRNDSEHVGGVAAPKAMAATMQLRRDGLAAIKSAFFFDDCVVALGAGISASNPEFREVTTAIDQKLSQGRIRAGRNWMHHASCGYVSLDGAPIFYSDKVQSGSWEAIDPALKGVEDSKRVFTCYFRHNPEKLASGLGSYAYMILPGASASETSSVASACRCGSSASRVRVLRNDSQCQAVRHESGVLCAVFHVPGNYTLDGESFEVPSPRVLVADGADLQSSELPLVQE